mmetsp:Transcript_19705/g.17416  ORF Transcript_19705/g.17416 Transcript_19705/m.17416 type:complete len:183 (-) Transcript_19705:48-596(-)
MMKIKLKYQPEDQLNFRFSMEEDDDSLDSDEETTEEVKMIEKGYLIVQSPSPTINIAQKLMIELEIFPGTLSTSSKFTFNILLQSRCIKAEFVSVDGIVEYQQKEEDKTDTVERVFTKQSVKALGYGKIYQGVVSLETPTPVGNYTLANLNYGSNPLGLFLTSVKGKIFGKGHILKHVPLKE